MIVPDTEVIPISPKTLRCRDPAWILLEVDTTNLVASGSIPFTVLLTDPKGRSLSLLTGASTLGTMTQFGAPTAPSTNITLEDGSINIQPLPQFMYGHLKSLVPWDWQLSTNFGVNTPVQILRCDTLQEALDFL